MIILYDAILGCVRMIIFQLIERIALAKKVHERLALSFAVNMLGFSYPAKQTRHEVCIEPYLREDILNVE